MPYTSISIIYNPNSTGDSGSNAQELELQLTEFGLKNVQLVATEYAGHAQELAYTIAKSGKRPLIVSASGDGGYNEVINGALEAQSEGCSPICAVLASGNANDHSRTLQDSSLHLAIRDENEVSIDVLKCEVTTNNKATSRYAHSYIGLGLTPIVAVELNKTSLNAIKEAWIVMRTFAKFRPFKIRKDSTTSKLDSIVFANIGEMAKVLTLSKDSKPDDGVFEVVTFAHTNKFGLVKKIAEATVTGLQDSEQHSSYSFTVLKKMPMQYDGEVGSVQKGDSIVVTSVHKVLRTIL